MQRLQFIGVFRRFGIKTNWHGFPEKTILLNEIKNKEEKIVSDHLWFNYTKGFQKLGELKEGDTIEFHARVRKYAKGYVNNREYIDEREIDYKLSNPTKFKRIDNSFDYNEKTRVVEK